MLSSEEFTLIAKLFSKLCVKAYNLLLHNEVVLVENVILLSHIFHFLSHFFQLSVILLNPFNKQLNFPGFFIEGDLQLLRKLLLALVSLRLS